NQPCRQNKDHDGTTAKTRSGRIGHARRGYHGYPAMKPQASLSNSPALSVMAGTSPAMAMEGVGWTRGSAVPVSKGLESLGRQLHQRLLAAADHLEQRRLLRQDSCHKEARRRQLGLVETGLGAFLLRQGDPGHAGPHIGLGHEGEEGKI